MNADRMGTIGGIIALAGIFVLGSGCELRKRMYDQPRYEPYEESDFFGDRRSARPIIEGSVARGQLNDDEHFYKGTVNGEPATTLPMEITGELLERGRSRYDIYCSVCHDRAGYGNGMVAQRGFKHPPSYHIDRLRAETPGYFYDVITSGFGTMPNYAYQLKPADRWAVVAYIRALQLSQNAAGADAPEDAFAATPKEEDEKH